jgi:hypothetical protein
MASQHPDDWPRGECRLTGRGADVLVVPRESVLPYFFAGEMTRPPPGSIPPGDGGSHCLSRVAITSQEQQALGRHCVASSTAARRRVQQHPHA